ncbi:hypothetical protein LAZ67_12003587 [Cordylochernes scorpioides]|uniref:Uncharacterized protein n=1 Tax=Cordylochernes scorpioides TaxID=51811 RepID=A0ABY6L5Z5_9ARAC|nr:hypothetical protein LAZ67_12003587 [Cordylochernes scorpioides]
MIRGVGNWVPCELNPRDIECRFSREKLLQRPKKKKNERKGFLHQIVTDDEKWVHYDYPKRWATYEYPGLSLEDHTITISSAAKYAIYIFFVDHEIRGVSGDLLQRLRLSELETEAFLPNTDLEIFLILSFKWHFDVILDFALVQRMQCLKSDGPWSNSQRLVRQLSLL